MSSVDLSYEQIESLITEINLGGRIVSIEREKGSPVILFLSHCTGLDKMRAEYEYKKAYNKAIEDGFMTAEETRKLLLEKGKDGCMRGEYECP